MSQQTLPVTAEQNASRRRTPKLGDLSRLKTSSQSRNVDQAMLEYSKSAYTGRTQETVPKLYQALLKQGDAQLRYTNSQTVMHQSHLPARTTLKFHEVSKAVSDFEN